MCSGFCEFDSQWPRAQCRLNLFEIEAADSRSAASVFGHVYAWVLARHGPRWRAWGWSLSHCRSHTWIQPSVMASSATTSTGLACSSTPVCGTSMTLFHEEIAECRPVDAILDSGDCMQVRRLATADETKLDSLLVPPAQENAHERRDNSLVVLADERRCSIDGTSGRDEVRAIIVSFLRNT